VRSTVAALVVPASAAAFDPVVEALNFNTALLAQVSLANEKGALTAQAADPGREFQTGLCARGYADFGSGKGSSLSLPH
jgi:hypothetical protein